jgi:hypothetical protein
MTMKEYERFLDGWNEQWPDVGGSWGSLALDVMAIMLSVAAISWILFVLITS